MEVECRATDTVEASQGGDQDREPPQQWGVAAGMEVAGRTTPKVQGRPSRTRHTERPRRLGGYVSWSWPKRRVDEKGNYSKRKGLAMQLRGPTSELRSAAGCPASLGKYSWTLGLSGVSQKLTPTPVSHGPFGSRTRTAILLISASWLLGLAVWAAGTGQIETFEVSPSRKRLSECLWSRCSYLKHFLFRGCHVPCRFAKSGKLVVRNWLSTACWGWGVSRTCHSLILKLYAQQG
jgi:hypothetical protein